MFILILARGLHMTNSHLRMFVFSLLMATTLTTNVSAKWPNIDWQTVKNRASTSWHTVKDNFKSVKDRALSRTTYDYAWLKTKNKFSAAKDVAVNTCKNSWHRIKDSSIDAYDYARRDKRALGIAIGAAIVVPLVVYGIMKYRAKRQPVIVTPVMPVPVRQVQPTQPEPVRVAVNVNRRV